jgi:hypothetical protein
VTNRIVPTHTSNGVLLVGSVPLDSAEEVFRTVIAFLGDCLRRVPDGETGDRRYWVTWQRPVFADHPDFDPVPAVAFLSGPQMPTIIQFRVRDHVDPGGVRFGRLGYADAAIASYAVFARLKAEGVIPAGVRFQVSLPTPINPLIQFVTAPLRLVLVAPYEAALLRELNQILTAIPGDQLAIQWDAPFEVRTWAGIWAGDLGDRVPPNHARQMLERLVRLGECVPRSVELGYHLCYGDYEHMPPVVRAHPEMRPPADARGVTELASTLCAEISRPVDFIHIPVPRENGANYLAPLADLRLPAATELYLGVVHLTDGLAGAQRRIDAARRVIAEFGVATECGWGRRPPDTIPELLQLHKKISTAAAG